MIILNNNDRPNDKPWQGNVDKWLISFYVQMFAYEMQT
jgi:hypothetical protein